MAAEIRQDSFLQPPLDPPAVDFRLACPVGLPARLGTGLST